MKVRLLVNIALPAMHIIYISIKGGVNNVKTIS